ncbi:MAG: hypothetical protein ABIR47_14595 [Candidatus Kapaibacterium sp.]
MTKRLLIAYLETLAGAPFAGRLRVYPLGPRSSDPTLVAPSVVEYQFTAGRLPLDAEIWSPGRYRFELADASGARFRDPLDADVAEADEPISLNELYRQVVGTDPIIDLHPLYDGDDLRRLSSAGVANGRVATADGADGIEWRDLPPSGGGSGGTAIKRAKLVHRTAAGSHGGTMFASTWNLVPLNTTVYDEIGVTLSLSHVTLPAGTYYIDASAPACAQANLVHYLRLSAGGSVVEWSPLVFDATENTQDRAELSRVRLVLIAPTVISLEHFAGGGRPDDGMGRGWGSGGVGYETHAVLLIEQTA